MEQSLTVIKRQVTMATSAAEELKITSDEGMTEAAGLLAKIKTVQKAVKEESGKIIEPLREAKRQAQAAMDAESLRWEPMLEDCSKAESIVKNKSLEYRQKVNEEAERVKEELAEKAREIERQKEAGEISEKAAEKKLEKVDDKIFNLERVETSVNGAKGGGMNFRKVAKLKIVDESKIPDEYWTLDMVKLRKDVLADIHVNGCEKEMVEEVAGKSY